MPLGQSERAAPGLAVNPRAGCAAQPGCHLRAARRARCWEFARPRRSTDAVRAGDSEGVPVGDLTRG